MLMRATPESPRMFESDFIDLFSRTPWTTRRCRRRSAMAQPDLVHLTGTGYQLIAKMLFDELMLAAPTVPAP